MPMRRLIVEHEEWVKTHPLRWNRSWEAKMHGLGEPQINLQWSIWNGELAFMVFSPLCGASSSNVEKLLYLHLLPWAWKTRVALLRQAVTPRHTTLTQRERRTFRAGESFKDKRTSHIAQQILPLFFGFVYAKWSQSQHDSVVYAVCVHLPGRKEKSQVSAKLQSKWTPESIRSWKWAHALDSCTLEGTFLELAELQPDGTILWQCYLREVLSEQVSGLTARPHSASWTLPPDPSGNRNGAVSSV